VIGRNDERLQSIPSEHRPPIERTVELIGVIGREQLARQPEWLVERLEQQALSIASAQYHLAQKDEQLRQMQSELEGQQQQIQALEAKLEQAQRSEKRQAAPYGRSPEQQKPAPKRPGRKGGHRGQWRQPPPPHPEDEHIEVPLEHCPHCEHPLDSEQQQALEQTILELPVVTPRVIRLRTYRNHCSHCHCQVRSTHPLQVSTAGGAASTQLGPQAVGVATQLNKQLGLPLRKTCAVLEQMMGLTVSPGGLSQAMERAARQLQPRYDELLEHLLASAALYTDETSWRVDGSGYCLWVLTTEQGTYYRIVPSRSKDAAEALIGKDFGGVLVSDCLNIYDDLTPLQHKCYAHHLKAISEALNTPGAENSGYLMDLRALLHSAMVLKRHQGEVSESTMTTVRQWLEARADELLQTPRGDPQTTQERLEEKIRRRLAKQRDHLFTFLDYPAVAATNNAAERQIRPAVITRKISCGNKTLTGAHTWEVLSSVAATAQQQGESFVDLVAQAISLEPPQQ